MNIDDITRIREIVHNSLAGAISNDLGNEGLLSLRKVLGMVRELARSISIEHLDLGLMVVHTWEEYDWPMAQVPLTLTDVTDLIVWHNPSLGALNVWIDNKGKILAWHGETSLEGISVPFISYSFEGFQEEYITTPHSRHQITPWGDFPSTFAIPYFMDLRKALKYYGDNFVRNAQCEIFKQSWSQPARIYFRNKPEATMRQSLKQYLRGALRDRGDIRVFPEQNVNDTKPVDIKVNWPSTNRVALIEIKWLGLSVDEPSGRKTAYSASRARDGVKQLLEYLDLHRAESPGDEARGFLVVFDGRRKHVSAASSLVDAVSGMHYANAEIDYQDLLSRTDLEHPIRFFCEPNFH
jgi:hypothetical protein